MVQDMFGVVSNYAEHGDFGLGTVSNPSPKTHAPLVTRHSSLVTSSYFGSLPKIFMIVR